MVYAWAIFTTQW